MSLPPTLVNPQENLLPADVLAIVEQYAPTYYAEIRNPKWANPEHTLIDCEVNFHHVKFEVWTPFTANPTDNAPYSKKIFDDCAAGLHGPVAEYAPPEGAPGDPELAIQKGIVI